ncbi:MAG: hypothetical protein AAF699_13925 [Pseudomonadota bacterium]
MKLSLALTITVLLALPCHAQTTCFTNRQGTTLCSTPSGVVNGSTNRLGDSTFRDSSGNRLNHELDPIGNNSLELSDGETVQWSQPAPVDTTAPNATESIPRAEPPPPIGTSVSPTGNPGGQP